MKFAVVLAIVAAATVVSAETNAQRMARGLPPNAPAKRATPAYPARRGHASSTPGNQCNGGTIQCCNSVQTTGNGNTCDEVANGLGLSLASGIPVGLTCVPILGSTQCNQQTVCCEDNSFNGIISIGCTPINIGL